MFCFCKTNKQLYKESLFTVKIPVVNCRSPHVRMNASGLAPPVAARTPAADCNFNSSSYFRVKFQRRLGVIATRPPLLATPLLSSAAPPAPLPARASLPRRRARPSPGPAVPARGGACAGRRAGGRGAAGWGARSFRAGWPSQIHL